MLVSLNLDKINGPSNSHVAYNAFMYSKIILPTRDIGVHVLESQWCSYTLLRFTAV